MTGPLRASDVDQDLQTIIVGIKAPDFSLPTVETRFVRLSDFRERRNVVIFFMRAFNCTQCREYARRLIEAHEELKKRDSVLYIIGPGTRLDAEKLNRALNASGKALIANDGTGAVYDSYILNKVFFSLLQKSATFVIDKAGTVRYAVATANAFRWLSGKALELVLAALDEVQANPGKIE